MESVETVLVAQTIGFPLRIVHALVLEAFLSALKLALFFLPSGLGAKDLGYFAMFATFGIRATTAQIGSFVILKRMILLFWLVIGHGILLSQGIRPMFNMVRLKPTAMETP